MSVVHHCYVSVVHRCYVSVVHRCYVSVVHHCYASVVYFRKPCRVKYMYTADGEKVRVSRRSGRIIPYPVHDKEYSRIAFPGMYVHW